MAKKNYVIDTSVYLTDAKCVFKFGNNDIFVPLKVLEEVDKHKKRQDSVGFNARQIIKTFDTFREKGSLTKGVRIARGKGIIKVCESTDLLSDNLDQTVPDHMILSSALGVQKEYPNRKTIVVSRDINMRVISDSIGILSEDYITSQVIEDADKLYTGFVEMLVDDQFIDQFYSDEKKYLDRELCQKQKIKPQPNQFVMLVSSSNEKKTALCRFINFNSPIKKVFDSNERLRWGIYPRNKEQSFAYDLLFDQSIPLVTLIGKAGSGKTLMAISAAIEQTLDE